MIIRTDLCWLKKKKGKAPKNQGWTSEHFDCVHYTRSYKRFICGTPQKAGVLLKNKFFKRTGSHNTVSDLVREFILVK